MKRHHLSRLALPLFVLGAVACSEKTTSIEPTTVVGPDPNECYYPGSETRAPDWVCGTPVEGYPVSSIGSFRGTGAGISFARNQAAADGRVQLATEMRAKVGAMVKNHAETTGVGDQETIDAVASVTQRQITAEMLYGSKAIQYRTGPDGTTYALVVLDAQQAATAAKQAAQNSYKNQQAAWQRFLGEKAQQELGAEMDKMIEGEFGAEPQS
jgi:hypothetical protein